VRKLVDDALLRAEQLRDAAKQLLRDFRGSTRTFKLKLAIIGGYFVIAATTIVLVKPAADARPAAKEALEDQLGAQVTVEVNDLLGGERFLLIKNQSDEPWLNCVSTVNWIYQARIERVEANGQTSVQLGQHQKVVERRNGKRLTRPLLRDERLESYHLGCGDPYGSYLLDLSGS
jgi:hypothetical protein